MILRSLPLVILVLLTSSCARQPDEPQYRPSPSLPAFEQASFADYARDTRRWLAHNRVFVGTDTQAELDANSPFERVPSTPTHKGVLLVHGLSDSPAYFSDLANTLAAQGFLVRTLLLPGHGSRPADLTLATLAQWNRAVAHHTNLLAQQVDELWLGGFSTGANLVTTQAIQDDRVQGLLLFSPGLVPRFRSTALTPYLTWLSPWANVDPETNYYRYESLTMQGAASYYQSSVQVRELLDRHGFSRPVLITISEQDSVIDAEAVAQRFQQQFTHTDSRLIWYGKRPADDPRIEVFAGTLPEQRIASIAHMSVLFREDHPHYGRRGAYRICDNGQNASLESHCRSGGDSLWFGAWGTTRPHTMVARLTWNPYYHQLEQRLAAFTARR